MSHQDTYVEGYEQALRDARKKFELVSDSQLIEITEMLAYLAHKFGWQSTLNDVWDLAATRLNAREQADDLGRELAREGNDDGPF